MPPKFVPRQRKHKVLARQKLSSSSSGNGGNLINSNTEQIFPLTKSEKETRREKLREELRAQQLQSKVSSKKQKRLDKYIDNKLKKDENLDLVRKLEKEKEKFNTTGLQSSTNLRKRRFEEYVNGQTNTTSSKNTESQAAVVVERHSQGRLSNADGVRDQKSYDDEANGEAEDDVLSIDSFEQDHQEAFDEDGASDSDAAWMSNRAPALQGSGLAQPLQLGSDGLPVIKVRGGRKKPKKNESQEQDELPWEGFDHEVEGQMADGIDPNTLSDEVESEEDPASEDDTNSDIESGGSSDESGSESASSVLTREQTKIRPRVSAFKSWATQQLNQSIGHTPDYKDPDVAELLPVPLKPTGVDQVPKIVPKLINGLPEVKGDVLDRRIYSVQVTRPEAIQDSRTQLPILQKEQEIMETIHAHPVVVIKGETGSGKTTQIPQFLYEAGYGDPTGPTPGMIGITQPRRVAAVSMAQRVGEELGEHGSKAAHQIRFDSNVSSTTAIKFMTDGILLRELSQDLLLKKYSVIVIDEAHERSVNTDILIGMLSKIVPARMQRSIFNSDPKPLKLIIMSATLNIEDFLHERLFSAQQRPPVVEAEGRQHKVTTHFALRSRADYLDEVTEKVKRAHKKLPRGGILVFLTGQMEIHQVQKRLRQDLARSSGLLAESHQPRMHIAASEVPLEAEDLDFGNMEIRRDIEQDDIDILTGSELEDEDHEFDISDNEDQEPPQVLGEQPKPLDKDPYDSVHILPLYSQLSTKEQLRVFQPSPDRSRMIVLATNVAETSLTIPGIRFVFDTGRAKERTYDLSTGVQKFEIDYISKASASQRAGRAGRTGGPGHCWRLYTSAVYERFFPDHSEPEILRQPVENVVLLIKGLKYPKPVAEFPFPNAPSTQAIDKAERLLRNLGVLDTRSGMITDLGRQLSVYPLSPRLGKILATAVNRAEAQHGILTQIVALIAGLTVGDIFVNTSAMNNNEDDEAKDENDLQKQAYGRVQATLTKKDKNSDAMKMLTAIQMYMEAVNKEDFCNQHFVKSKVMAEVAQLAQQLRSIIQANHPNIAWKSSSTSKTILNQTRQINTTSASGYIDQIAIRWDCHPNPPTIQFKPRRAIDVPYLPLIPLSTSTSEDLTSKAIFIHPSSVLSRLSTKELPQYIIYTHLQQSQPHTIAVSVTPKTRMFPLTPIDGTTLTKLAQGTSLLVYGKPVPKTKIEDVSTNNAATAATTKPNGALGNGIDISVNGSSAKDGKKRRVCWVTTELRCTIAGSTAWPLPPSKVQQVIDLKSPTGWRVEHVLA